MKVSEKTASPGIGWPNGTWGKSGGRGIMWTALGRAGTINAVAGWGCSLVFTFFFSGSLPTEKKTNKQTNSQHKQKVFHKYFDHQHLFDILSFILSLNHLFCHLTT